MQLSEALIAKFQQAHLYEYGEAVSAEKAEAELLGLAELVSLTQPSIKQMNKEMQDEEDDNKGTLRT